MNPYGLILALTLFALLVTWGLIKIVDKGESDE